VFVPQGTRTGANAGYSLWMLREITQSRARHDPRHAPLARRARGREHPAEAAGHRFPQSRAPPRLKPAVASQSAPSPSCSRRLSPLSHRPPRHRYPLAPLLVETTLAATISPTSRATAHRCGHPSPHPPHVDENPTWVKTKLPASWPNSSLRISENRLQVQASAAASRARPEVVHFVRNHLSQTWAVDWFTIVTLRFQVLYAFVILDLGRREIVRVGVTSTQARIRRPDLRRGGMRP